MQNQSLELGAEPLEAGGPQIPYRRLLALRHQCVVAVSTSLNLKTKPGRELTTIEGEFIITCRPSLALLRGLFHYRVPGRV